MSTWLQSSGQFLQAVGPLVQQGIVPQEMALEMLAASSRNYRLGKAAEDLDRSIGPQSSAGTTGSAQAAVA